MHLVLFRLQSLMMEPLGIQIRGVMMKLVMPLMLKMRLLVRKLAMTGQGHSIEANWSRYGCTA